jgi:KaiC/GvpD/RAD55 family RecA-like ATPase
MFVLLPVPLALPILKQMVPGGLTYGGHYVVEYDPDSPWYETSLTITAEALSQGIRTEYHVFTHPPEFIRQDLARLGLNAKQLEEEDSLRILDTYDVMTGLAAPEKPEAMARKGREPFETHHEFDLVHWSGKVEALIKQGMVDEEKRWLHLDDNTSILNHYSDEKLMIDVWRTRFLPYARVRELAMIHSFVTGIASETFYRNFEALCDGIFDMRSLEEQGSIQHYARARTMRGTVSDTRWRRLQLSNNGRVQVDSSPAKVQESNIGLGGWLKGPGKRER